MTTALLLASEAGERAAQALVPQAFHGPNVPTPVLTVPGDPLLRDHALAFRPSLAPDGDPFGIDLLWTKNGTLLTPAMLAAYTSPNLFEEGTAVTIQEKLPPLAFYPELPGEVVLGHQVSPETGDLTLAPLAPEPRRALPHRVLRRHRLRQERGRGAHGLRDHAALAAQDHRARFRHGLAATAQRARPGGARGDPPAFARRGAAAALEPAAGRPQRAARGPVARVLGHLRHHRPARPEAPDPRAARDPAPGLPLRRRAGGRSGVPQRSRLGHRAARRSAVGRLPGGHTARQPGPAGAAGVGRGALAPGGAGRPLSPHRDRDRQRARRATSAARSWKASPSGWSRWCRGRPRCSTPPARRQ